MKEAILALSQAMNTEVTILLRLLDRQEVCGMGRVGREERGREGRGGERRGGQGRGEGREGRGGQGKGGEVRKG